MSNIGRRLAQLEARAPCPLSALSDDDLCERIVGLYRRLEGSGLDLPHEWESDFRADPDGFHRRMEPCLAELATELAALI